jgi:peptidyl-tRNA hydrolase, PTH2 family
MRKYLLMKQVLVVNEMLKLPRGKLAAQVAHAAVAAFLAAGEEAQHAWLVDGMAKIVLKGRDEEHLRHLEMRARQRGVPACLIIDGGKTVVPAGTITCLGLGPAEEIALDELTGDLKLLG